MKEKITFENQNKTYKASRIIVIPFVVALIMAIFELAPAAVRYKEGMGIFAFIANTSSGIPYYFALILVLTATFPIAYCVFHDNGIDFRSCVVERSKLMGDIFFGILAAILSYGLSFLVNHVLLQYPLYRPAFNGTWILSFVSLVLVSGFFKEIYFRGLANHFLKRDLGEWQSFLLTNILFAVLDWPNLGMSFLYGLIWIAFYRKRNRIIVPIIAHGLHNLISISIGFFF